MVLGQHYSLCFKLDSSHYPLALALEGISGIHKITKDTCLTIKSHTQITYSNSLTTDTIILNKDTIVKDMCLSRIVSQIEISVSDTADLKQILFNKSSKLLSMDFFAGQPMATYEEIHRIDSSTKSYGRFEIYLVQNEQKKRRSFPHIQDSIYCSDQYADFLGYINYLHILEIMYEATRIPNKVWKKGDFIVKESNRSDTLVKAYLKHKDISYEFVANSQTFEIIRINRLELKKFHDVHSGNKAIKFKQFYVHQSLDFNYFTGQPVINSFKLEHWGQAEDAKSRLVYFDYKGARFQFSNSPSLPNLDISSLQKLKAHNICAFKHKGPTKKDEL